MNKISKLFKETTKESKRTKSRVFSDISQLEEYFITLDELQESLVDKYPKPKIILLDFEESVLKSLKNSKHRISGGIISPIYRNENPNRYEPSILCTKLPNIEEQEVIFINLKGISSQSNDVNFIHANGKNSGWEGTDEIVDPRGIVLMNLQDKFERISAHGGLFVVFANPRKTKNFRDSMYQSELKVDNWFFLTIFNSNQFNFRFNQGNEYYFSNRNNSINSNIEKIFSKTEISYYTTIEPMENNQSEFKSLIFNKYNECIGGLVSFNDNDSKILILPHVSDYSYIIESLLNETLPELSPTLFPHVKRGKWLEEVPYKLPEVFKIENKIKKLLETYNNEMNGLNQELREKKNELKFLFELLTETNNSLVRAVKIALEFIGFEKVINVDDEIEDRNKQEDLQILDNPDKLIIEVKGIENLPDENTTNQVYKYVIRRGKEWETTKILGMTIVNHQRNIPAIERDNDNIFTTQQIDDAKGRQVLISTWDIFKIIKGMITWKWKKDFILPIFYRTGRPELIPSHYENIGEIIKIFSKNKIIAVRIIEGELNTNDIIGGISQYEFFETKILSMGLKKEEIRQAKTGDEVGIRVSHFDEFKSLKVIFKVKRE